MSTHDHGPCVGIGTLGRGEACIAECQEPNIIRGYGLEGNAYIVVMLRFMEDLVCSH